MAVTSKVSEEFTKECLTAEHDLVSDTIKCALLGATFTTYDPAIHKEYGTAGISSTEVASGNGYTTGGVTLANIAVTIASNKSHVACDNAAWTAAVGAIADAKAAVIYNGTHASKTIICCIEFGATYSTPVGTSLEIDFSNGLLQGTPNLA